MYSNLLTRSQETCEVFMLDLTSSDLVWEVFRQSSGLLAFLRVSSGHFMYLINKKKANVCFCIP